MMIRLAPALLLAALSSPDGRVAAFNGAARGPSSASRIAPSTAAMASSNNNNDFDAHYDVDVDRRGNIRDISPSGIERRDALSRFAAAAGLAATIFGGAVVDPAFAAQAPEFSESPTSEAAIGRMAYDGKVPPPAPAPAAVEEVVAAPKAEAAAPDFDGNEAGSVGATDEGTQRRTMLDPRISLPPLPGGLDFDPNDPRLLYGGAAIATGTILVTATAGGGQDAEDEFVSKFDQWKESNPSGGAPPGPYGLNNGRNIYGNVDMNAAKVAGLTVTPPVKKAAAPAPPAPAPLATPAAEEVSQEEKPGWALDLPTPYGLQNAGGKNPFIKGVMEYCEGGKVTEDCTDTIKGYLDELSDSGAVATTGEVTAIVSYLGSLGSDSGTETGKKAGAAFTSYLDALSAGSAPPPSSAKAVKTYLDTLAGYVSASPQSETREAMESPIVAAEPAQPEPVAAVAAEQQGPDFSGFDDRLTHIEGRVSGLETKVDALPDQVFAKIEAWQTRHEERLGEEVKKIVAALGTAPAPPAAVVVEDEPMVVEAPVYEEPAAVVVEPEPIVEAAPAVPATPLVGVIPERFGVPRPGGNASGPKKGFGFGGGASSWKMGKSIPPQEEPASVVVGERTIEASVPEPLPEPMMEEALPPAPVVGASPLGAAIPERTGLPRAGSNAESGKSYGLGGGAKWKNMSP